MAVLGRVPVVGDEVDLPDWSAPGGARWTGAGSTGCGSSPVPRPGQQAEAIATRRRRHDPEDAHEPRRRPVALARCCCSATPSSSAPSSPSWPRAARQLEPLAARRQHTGRRSASRPWSTSRSMLACAQLGITVCSVGLGAVAEAALHEMLVAGPARCWACPRRSRTRSRWRWRCSWWSTCTSSSARWCPRTSRSPARTRPRCVLAPPLLCITRALRPLIRLMEGVAKALVRALGIEPKDELASAFTAEEVQHIVAESHREGLIEDEQHGLVTGGAGVQRPGRRRRRGPAGPARHRPRRRAPRTTSSGWWPSTGSPGSRSPTPTAS